HLSASLSGRFDGSNGADDTRIGSAPAYVAVHETTDLFFGRFGIPFQQRCRCHDHARRAIRALKRIRIYKSLLYRVEFARRRESFDDDAALVDKTGGRRDTRPCELAIYQHRTDATRTLAATILRPDEIEIIPQHPA